MRKYFLSLFFILCFATNGLSQTSYRVSSVSDVSGSAYKINNTGGIVGRQNGEAVLWAFGETFSFGTQGIALDLNDSFEVVGYVENVGFYFDGNGSSTGFLGPVVPAQLNPSTQVTGINDAGTFVGQDFLLRHPTTARPFFAAWLASNGTEVRPFFPDSNNPSNANLNIDISVSSISNSNSVVGTRLARVSPTAYRITDSGITSLFGVQGGDTFGVDINSSNTAVGLEVTATRTAMRWDSAFGVSLGTLAGLENSEASGINENGVIVGQSWNSNEQRAFVHYGTQMIDLNQHVVDSQSWLLETARDINELGQIIGDGVNNGISKPFVATPVLEWEGNDNGDWDDSSNWSHGINPSSVHPVTIIGNSIANGPTETARVGELFVEHGSRLNLKNGELIVDSANASWNSGEFQLEGVLSGQGVLAARSVIDGTIEPGDSAGILVFLGETQFTENANVEIEIFANGNATIIGNTIFSENDFLLLADDVNLSGAIEFDLTGFLGDSFVEAEFLRTSGQILGNFDEVSFEGIGAEEWKNYSVANRDGSLFLTFVAVPEPNSVLVLLSFLTLISGHRRRTQT